MQSNAVHDLVVVPAHSGSMSAASGFRKQVAKPGQFFGGITVPTTEYELRLFDCSGRSTKIFRFVRPNDDAARRVILNVPDDFERYELWRGMEKIDAGGRLIVR